MRPFEGRPGIRLAAQLLLGVFGFGAGFALIENGLLSAIGFFGESTDLQRAVNLSTFAGLTLVIWTWLGIARPTPLRYLPPTICSIAITVWFFGVY